MTRDSYAKELIKAAEAAFIRNETPTCPHPECEEQLSVVKQSMFSTRSLFCPIHGRIFQEQKSKIYEELDWEAAAARAEEHIDSELEEDDEEEFEDDFLF